MYVICSRQCPNGDGIYTLLYALYKYSTSITNQPTQMRETLLLDLSVRHIIWSITASTDFSLYIVICLCVCELHIVNVYIWYLSNFDKLIIHV